MQGMCLKQKSCPRIIRWWIRFWLIKTEAGLEKALEKTDEFNPPPNDNFERVYRTIEVLYSGAKVLGTNTMLKWELA